MRSLLAAVRSDVGKVREINEDCVYLSEPYTNELMIAIVADGMGGHLAGEIASKTAVETIYQELQSTIQEQRTIEEYQNALEFVIRQANSKVYQQSINQEDYRGMGTTIIASIISPQWIIIGHIGDSRAYLFTENQVKQLTTDHSLVNELLKSGQISQEEAINHPKKNVLTRALGTDENVKIDMHVIEWSQDQTLLLCTDGLTNRLSEEKILSVVNQARLSPQEITDHLVELANQAGGEDNISVIVIRHD